MDLKLCLGNTCRHVALSPWYRSGKEFLVRSVFFWVLTISATACGVAQPSSTKVVNSSETVGPELQKELDLWIADPKHRGVSASVIFADGSQWEGVDGLSADGEALQSNHLISIASITKTMTGALILQLASESALSLDDPVSRWLPPRMNIDTNITIRQLLNHTNGLANYTANPAFAAVVSESKVHIFSIEELLTFVGPPQFAPGEGVQYTNTAFILLGEILERVTGKPIEELYHERLWDPIGLKEIFLPVCEEPPGLVAFTLGNKGLVDPSDQISWFSAMYSAFGLMASARNIACWGHALFEDNVLTVEMQKEMRTVVPASGSIPGEQGVGLGIRSYHYLGRIQYGHSGGSPFGSSLLLYDPQTRVIVAVLMNQSSGADHFTLAPKLLDIASQDQASP